MLSGVGLCCGAMICAGGCNKVDGSAGSAGVAVQGQGQGQFSVPLAELRRVWEATLPELFG